MKELPARRSRGNRIHKLLGEEAEADAAFWSQEVWNEDAEDSDYESEEEEEDAVDSDFDVEEQPDDEVHGDDDAEDSRGRRARESTRRGAYSEPQRAPKRPRTAVKSGENTTANAPANTQPKSVTPRIAYEAPTLRESTARKSSDSTEFRRKILEEAARLSAKIKRAPVAKTRLTQEELLIEAVRTEVENTQSLNRLQRLEEEKKAENAVAPKAPFTGMTVRYHSRIGTPKTITFLNTDQFPSIFNQPPAKKRERVRVEEPVEEEEEKEEEEEGEDGGDVSQTTADEATAEDDTGEDTADGRVQ